jgi:hypothetical protein
VRHGDEACPAADQASQIKRALIGENVRGPSKYRYSEDTISDDAISKAACSKLKKRFSCRIDGCSEAFKSASQANHHMKREHMEAVDDELLYVIRVYPCRVAGCGNKKYKTIQGCNHHMAKEHPGVYEQSKYPAVESTHTHGRAHAYCQTHTHTPTHSQFTQCHMQLYRITLVWRHP